MAFLTPLFWIATIAISVPVLLHLVQKESQQKVPFSSLMLMPKVPVKQMKRRRLKHLFLLFLRCLGLLLLITAFARPVATSAFFARFNPLTSRSVLLLVDNSMSMSRSAVWDRALAAARSRLDSLGEDDEAMLVVFGDSAQSLTQWERSAEVVRNQLAGLQPSFSTTSYVEALRMAVDQFDQDRNPRREIFLVTDLQQTGLTSSRGWKVPEEIIVHLEDVGEDSANLYIDEVRMNRTVYGKQYPVPILARVVHQPASELNAEAVLYLADRIVDRQKLEIGQEGAGQVTFQPFELDEGMTPGKIVIEPADALPQDNMFHFVLERRAPRKVLILTRAGRTSTFYLRQALSVGVNLPFDTQVVDKLPANLSPDEVALVVLNDVRTVPPRQQLESFLQAGGGVLVILGGNTRPDAFANLGDLMPAKIGERQYVRSRSRSFISMTQVSWDHPIFSVFQDIHKSAMASSQFYSFWACQPIAGATVAAGLEDGDPVLIERQVGQGRLLLFPAALEPRWTDFPLRSAFVPFWLQTARYASGWQQQPAAQRVNSTLVRSLDDDTSTWDVVDPSGKSVLGLSGRETGSVQLATPGIYEIRENKGTDWVAVNGRPLESDLTRMKAEDLEAVFIPSQSRTESVGGEEPVEAKEKQQSLWWLFLLSALAVFAIESVVANTRVTVSK